MNYFHKFICSRYVEYVSAGLVKMYMYAAGNKGKTCQKNYCHNNTTAVIFSLSEIVGRTINLSSRIIACAMCLIFKEFIIWGSLYGVFSNFRNVPYIMRSIPNSMDIRFFLKRSQSSRHTIWKCSKFIQTDLKKAFSRNKGIQSIFQTSIRFVYEKLPHFVYSFGSVLLFIVPIEPV